MTSLLTPYKYAGLDIVSLRPILMNNSQDYYLTLPSKYWYRVYQLPKLQITLDSVVFNGKIRAISQASNSTYIYVAVHSTIFVMNYQHCISKIELSQNLGKITHMAVLYPYCIASIKNVLFIHQTANQEQQTVELGWNILGIIHPPTLLNKIVVCTSQELVIVNFVTAKVIVSLKIETLVGKINKAFANHQFKIMTPSPALDVIAISLCEGLQNTIVLFNIYSFEVVQSYEVGQSVTDIDFNTQGKIPIMAYIQRNEIRLVDLNKREIIFTHKHEENLDWIKFVPNSPSLFIGSRILNQVQELTYDFDQPQLLSLIRERNGFKGNLSSLKFIGHEDDPLSSVNLIANSTYHNAELRFISLINENMSQTYTAKINKVLRKKKKLTEEVPGNHIGKIENFSFSINRENDWSNLLTIHHGNTKPCLWNTEAKSIVKKHVEINQTLEEKTKYQNSQVISIFVSNCGNFGFLGMNDGRVIKFTMQSGSNMKTYYFKNETRHIYVDQCNQFIILAQSNRTMLQLDFFSGKVFHDINLDSDITLINGSLTTTLLLTALENNTIIIWDYAQMKVIRRLVGHTQTILSATFTYDNQHVLSSSLDLTINIWSIVQGALIQRVTLKKPVINLDISTDCIKQIVIVFIGSLLCGIYQNSRSIAVFHTKLQSQYDISKAKKEEYVAFQTNLKIQPKDHRQQIYSVTQQMEEEVNKEQLLDLPVQENRSLIRFTILEDGRWVPLQHIDQIRERNKIKIPEEDIKIPFFMDFRNIDQEKQKLLNDIKETVKEKSKILTKEKDKYLAEISSEFIKYLNGKSSKNLLKYLKTLNPSQFDYELRTAFLGKPQNIVLMMEYFNKLFQEANEIDLKVTYLHRFLQIVQDDLPMIFDDKIKELMMNIKINLKNDWNGLEDMKEYIEGVIDYAKSR